MKHFVAYFALSLLLLQSFKNWVAKYVLLISVFFLSGIIELVQSFFERSVSFEDLEANLLGIMAAWCVIYIGKHVSQHKTMRIWKRSAAIALKRFMRRPLRSATRYVDETSYSVAVRYTDDRDK